MCFDITPIKKGLNMFNWIKKILAILVCFSSPLTTAAAPIPEIVAALLSRSVSRGEQLNPILKRTLNGPFRAQFPQEMRTIFSDTIYVGRNQNGHSLLVGANDLGVQYVERASTGGWTQLLPVESRGDFLFVVGKEYPHSSLRGISTVRELTSSMVDDFKALVSREFAEAGMESPSLTVIEHTLLRTNSEAPYGVTRLSLSGMKADPAILERVLQNFSRDSAEAATRTLQ
jgi:hypothetical protein